MTKASGKIAVWVSVCLAILAPTIQTLYSIGLNAAEFSYQGDSTLRVASYAFSIWSVLYIGMIAFAVYLTSSQSEDSKIAQHFTWPGVIAIGGCGLWIIAAAANNPWTTVFIIVLSAAVVIGALLTMPRSERGDERKYVLLPLAALAGWLTIASVANILTVLTMKGMVDVGMAPMAAIAGIGVAVILAAIVALKSDSVFYLMPIVWGLVAIGIAEIDPKPTVAMASFLGATLLAVMATLLQRANSEGLSE